jgi:hypothetical protein
MKVQQLECEILLRQDVPFDPPPGTDEYGTYLRGKPDERLRDGERWIEVSAGPATREQDRWR